MWITTQVGSHELSPHHGEEVVAPHASHAAVFHPGHDTMDHSFGTHIYLRTVPCSMTRLKPRSACATCICSLGANTRLLTPSVPLQWAPPCDMRLPAEQTLRPCNGLLETWRQGGTWKAREVSTERIHSLDLKSYPLKQSKTATGGMRANTSDDKVKQDVQDPLFAMACTLPTSCAASHEQLILSNTYQCR